jgi:hypothetical protein
MCGEEARKRRGGRLHELQSPKKGPWWCAVCWWCALICVENRGKFGLNNVTQAKKDTSRNRNEDSPREVWHLQPAEKAAILGPIPPLDTACRQEIEILVNHDLIIILVPGLEQLVNLRRIIMHTKVAQSWTKR